MAKWKILNIDFMRWRRVGLVLSTLVNLAAIGSLAVQGLNLSIEFTGGTVVELAFDAPPSLDDLRAKLKGSEFGSAIVQNFGGPRDVLVRLPPVEAVTSTEAASKDIGARMHNLLPEAEVRRVEFIGPQVGDELAEEGMIAALVALGCILVYVMLRFTFKFAVGAIAATVHDVPRSPLCSRSWAIR